MVFHVEYRYEDVASLELGRLGDLISSFEEQGWQPLDDRELQVVPEMFGLEKPGDLYLWMKRRNISQGGTAIKQIKEEVLI